MFPEKSLEGRQFFRLNEKEKFMYLKAGEMHEQSEGPEDEDEDEEDEDFDEELDDNRTYFIPGEDEEIIRREEDDEDEKGLNREYF